MQLTVHHTSLNYFIINVLPRIETVKTYKSFIERQIPTNESI